MYNILTAEEGRVFAIAAMNISRGGLTFFKFPVSNRYICMLGFITVRLSGGTQDGRAAAETGLPPAGSDLKSLRARKARCRSPLDREIRG